MRAAVDVVRAYFDCMRAGDRRVVELFHDDATLVGLGATRSGTDEIREWYSGVIERAGPSPSLVGDLLVSGDRVAAEIEITLSDDAMVHAVDVFVVSDGRIRSLTYFICAHADAASASSLSSS